MAPRKAPDEASGNASAEAGSEGHPAPPWTWAGAYEDVHVRFFGRRAAEEIEDLRPLLGPRPQRLERLHQIHSAQVVEIDSAPRTGLDQGDALITSTPDLGIAVVTADCVPVLLATADRIAAVHAGWRGLVEGVIPRAVERLTAEAADSSSAIENDEIEAWIGPAIGSCCYEVGHDVAQHIATATSPEVVVDTGGEKPHADLQLGAEQQLNRAGVRTVHRVDLCTRCHGELLWSYRREGAKAGRNWALIWRQA